ncbi:MAG: glycerophosphodiester phosphodiesterase [Flavobacterium sp.]|uniref:glycerophosphodiester phosphodiesterase family protein n=1 Tax=Flavobacterium sp. TaxID=239 RepID=UPI0012240965|nr:glycerophosphodiester phosphodiesterase family protein [Flavobacterium sp.]RZJ67274.1 MAG: glycerophosphodiester phosphodiesterase [Flavobacterium sp.]
MKIPFLSTIGLLMIIPSCKNTQQLSNNKQKVEVQGHRGDRGNFPENSLPAFYSAIDKGVDVLELDVVISQDDQVVVSHEPFMSSAYVLQPNGDSIPKSTEATFNLYKMPYSEIRKFDIGSKGNKLFPKQNKIKTYKPSLAEMIDSVEAYASRKKAKPVRYNIEIKSVPWEYAKTQPNPDVFVDLVMKVIRQKKIDNRINIQSFDPFILNEITKRYPQTVTAFLADKPGIAKNLSMLKKKPEIFSPHYSAVNAAMIDSLAKMNIKIIPWTVNETKDIDRMLSLKVDGIITDYPEKVLERR